MALSVKKAKILRCPICKMLVKVGDPDAPFCSDRCRVIDLGKWASGGYRISSPIMDPELLEEVEEQTLRRERSRNSEQ